MIAQVANAKALLQTCASKGLKKIVMKKQIISFIVNIIICIGFSSFCPPKLKIGSYYRFDSLGKNEYIKLNSDGTYEYKERWLYLSKCVILSNEGRYKIKNNKLILKSYNQLNPKFTYKVKETFDSKLKDSLKFIIHKPLNDTLMDMSKTKFRIRINSKAIGTFIYQDFVEEFKFKYDSEIPKYFDYELSGTMYKRYFIKRHSNVFEIVFFNKDKIDSTKNVFCSYWDNEIFYFKSDSEIGLDNRTSLKYDFCKGCDTMQKFKLLYRVK
jgi:hypothetical protein